jgi:flagellar FliL protein
MAEAAKKDSPNVKPLRPKKDGMLPVVLIIVGLLTVAGSVGAWLAFKPKPARVPAAGAGAAAAAASQPTAAPRAAPIYYKLDPAFVVNFGGEGSARYLQVTVEAMSRDAAALDALKNNEPAVRNDLVLLFSSQDSATLLSAAGKEKLRAATLDAIRKVLADEGVHGEKIEAVYFTSFVIQ